MRLNLVVLDLIPGVSRRGRREFAGIFAALFYCYGLVMAIRGGALLHLWNLGHGGRYELTLIVVAWAVLYVGAVTPVLLGRRLDGRPRRGFFRRLRANPAAVAGFCVVMVLVCAAILAPVVSVADPTAQESPGITRYRAPSLDHPMGTDRFGRDVYSRVLFGARSSLAVAVVSVLLAVLLGTAVGVLSGYAGGLLDEIVMRAVDGLLSFPRLLAVLTLVALFSNAYPLLVVAIAATGWMGVARLVRAEILRVKEREFVQAAVATGIGRWGLIVRHLLPNSAGPMIVAATLNVGGVILLESYLSFLGLGVQPPAPSWGAMVFDGRDVLLEAWWVSAFPALAIVLAVTACNMLGDGLHDALDTRA
jgi:peptide/nickel transport system permease protein